MSTDRTTLIEALEQAFGGHLAEAGSLARFPLMDLVPDGMLDEANPLDYNLIRVMEPLDIRTDVTVRCTFQGSLEEPPEYASAGDWALLDMGLVLATGRVMDEGEWDGDPFWFLRTRLDALGHTVVG